MSRELYRRLTEASCQNYCACLELPQGFENSPVHGKNPIFTAAKKQCCFLRCGVELQGHFLCVKKSKLQGEREITIGILGYSSLVKQFEKFGFHFWHSVEKALASSKAFPGMEGCDGSSPQTLKLQSFTRTSSG